MPNDRYQDLDPPIAALGLPEERALAVIREAGETGQLSFIGYDQRDPRPRSPKPIGPLEFVYTKIGQDGPRGKFCLYSGPPWRSEIVWTELKVREEDARKFLAAWRAWVAEWENMFRGNVALLAARAAAPPPIPPGDDGKPARKRHGTDAEVVELVTEYLQHAEKTGAGHGVDGAADWVGRTLRGRRNQARTEYQVQADKRPPGRPKKSAK